MKVDVIATEGEKDYYIEPISEIAKLICRKHKGVVMKKYAIPKFTIDSIQDMYGRYGAIIFQFIYK